MLYLYVECYLKCLNNIQLWACHFKANKNVHTNIPGNEYLLSLIETLDSQIYYIPGNVIFKTTYIIHLQYIPNLITISYCFSNHSSQQMTQVYSPELFHV